MSLDLDFFFFAAFFASFEFTSSTERPLGLAEAEDGVLGVLLPVPLEMAESSTMRMSSLSSAPGVFVRLAKEPERAGVSSS